MAMAEQRAIAALRVLNNPASSVNVSYSPSASRPHALRVAGLFETAGWDTTFNDLAQEQFRGYPHREGIEVAGVNEYLIKKIEGVLSRIDLPSIRVERRPNAISPTNPKYSCVVRYVELHVGHLATSKHRSRGVPEGIYGKVGAIAAVVGTVAAYVYAAREWAWWPF